MMRTKKQSHCWWFDSHNSPRRSPWLQSTLAELDEKTMAMLKLIEEDADSFARRAEMYYKKRPELINMVEDFYRAHRSLAERYDQIRSDPGARLGPTLSSPFLSTKYQQPEKPTSPKDQSCNNFTTIMGSPFSYNKFGQEKLTMKKLYDSYSETCDSELSGESEVDDPEQEDDSQGDKELGEEEEVSSRVSNVEAMKYEEIERLKEENKIQKEMYEEIERLKEKNKIQKELYEEIERLKEENKIQKEQLMQKDEEKREVIRQLSLAIQVLKEENASLRKSATKTSPKKLNPIELNKLKESFLGKLFIGSRPSVVAL